MAKLLFKNATVVCRDRIRRTDLLTSGAFIERIDKDIDCADAEVIDCRGLVMIPGLIDEHVHFRDLGLSSKATIASESKAAVLGGVTSFMDMPNTNPPTVDGKSLEDKKLIAARDSLANYAFYLGATPDNLEEIKKADPKSIAGIKVFMGATTGNLLVDDLKYLTKVFASAPCLVATHCESTEIIKKREQAAYEHYGDNIPFSMHPVIRNRDCCLKSSELAVELAKATGARLHIMHISTAEEVDLLRQYMLGDISKRQISGEACIPHLMFSDCDYDRLGGFLKCNPSVKTERDRLALVKAVSDGVLTTVGTDHAPHELEKKTGSYRSCASGTTSVQFSLLAMCDLWKRGELSLEEIVQTTSTNVALRYGIKNRGFIEEGACADLAVINPVLPHTVTKDEIASTCGWSPFVGHTFACSHVHTVVNGNLIVKDGVIVSDEKGQALEFAR